LAWSQVITRCGTTVTADHGVLGGHGSVEGQDSPRVVVEICPALDHRAAQLGVGVARLDEDRESRVAAQVDDLL
jgi:hypothetical protein